MVYGFSDDFGFKAVDQKVHCTDQEPALVGI